MRIKNIRASSDAPTITLMESGLLSKNDFGVVCAAPITPVSVADDALGSREDVGVPLSGSPSVCVTVVWGAPGAAGSDAAAAVDVDALLEDDSETDEFVVLAVLQMK